MNSLPATAGAGFVLFFCLAGEAILNPGGFVNYVFCNIIDVLVATLPSTPAAYKIGPLLQTFFQQYSEIGIGIFFDLFQTLFIIIGFEVTIKIVKFVRG